MIKAHCHSQEYWYLRKQKCECGSELQLIDQVLTERCQTFVDVHRTQCKQCGKFREFVFDISSFYNPLRSFDELAEVERLLKRVYPESEVPMRMAYPMEATLWYIEQLKKSNDIMALEYIAEAVQYAVRNTSKGERGMMQAKIEALSELNKQLSPPEQLCGLFLPIDAEQRDDVLLLAEMPSMNTPAGPINEPYNFGVTVRDRFFQDMLVQYGLSGVYVTDIVKQRNLPRRPTKEEVEEWLPFLKEELSILCPRTIIVIGKRTYFDSFLRLVSEHLDDHFQHDFIFHYCRRVPRKKFETRLREVVAQYNLNHQFFSQV